MYLYEVMHDGSLIFLLVVLAMVVALIMSQTVFGSGIARHPYSKPSDGGELATDLPFDSIGRPEFEPLLFRPRRRPRHSRTTHP